MSVPHFLYNLWQPVPMSAYDVTCCCRHRQKCFFLPLVKGVTRFIVAIQFLKVKCLNNHKTLVNAHFYRTVIVATFLIAPGNPTLWRGVPVTSIQNSFGSNGRDWKPWKKLPIPCKFCTYQFIKYSSTCYGKVRINPLMANIRNPDFFASPVATAAWFVVVRPCYLNRDLLSGLKGN